MPDVARLRSGTSEVKMKQNQALDGRGPGGEKLLLTVVVNGNPATIEVAPRASLKALVARALEETNSVGRPPDDWELRNEAGQSINVDGSAESNGLADGAVLFLSLKTGAAGA